MEHWKKVEDDGEVVVKSIGDDGNYAIASDRDPEPAGYTDHRWIDDGPWSRISRSDAAAVLGYDPEE